MFADGYYTSTQHLNNNIILKLVAHLTEFCLALTHYVHHAHARLGYVVTRIRLHCSARLHDDHKTIIVRMNRIISLREITGTNSPSVRSPDLEESHGVFLSTASLPNSGYRPYGSRVVVLGFCTHVSPEAFAVAFFGVIF